MDIRIEPKEYSLRRMSRFMNSPARYKRPQGDIYSILYQQAIQMGLPQYQAAAMFTPGQPGIAPNVSMVNSPPYGMYNPNQYGPMLHTPPSTGPRMMNPYPQMASPTPAGNIYYPHLNGHYGSPYHGPAPAFTCMQAIAEEPDNGIGRGY